MTVTKNTVVRNGCFNCSHLPGSLEARRPQWNIPNFIIRHFQKHTVVCKTLHMETWHQNLELKVPVCMELTIYSQTLGVFKLELFKWNSKETKLNMHKSTCKFVVFWIQDMGCHHLITFWHHINILRLHDVRSKNNYRVLTTKKMQIFSSV